MHLIHELKIQNINKVKRSGLLKNSGKHSIFVHIKVNTLYLAEDMQVLPNLITYEGNKC